MNQQSRMHGGEVFDTYTGNFLSVALENYPDLLCYKFLEVVKNLELQNAKASYLNLHDLRSMPVSRIFVCQNYKFSDNRWVEPIQLLPLIYGFLSSNDKLYTPTYVTEPNPEASILFDNSLDTKVHVWHVQLQRGYIDLYVKEIYTNLEWSGWHPWVIAKVTGKWSGTVYERPIISSYGNESFIFLGRHRLVVQTGSRLAQTIQELGTEGKVFAIAELAAKLQEASNGHVDSHLAKEWPELFIGR